MNQDDWRETRQVFDEALACRVETRRAYLDWRCRGRPGLRDEVEALLVAAAAAGDGGFLRDAVRAAARRLVAGA